MAMSVPSAVNSNSANYSVLAASGDGFISYVKCTNNSGARRWYWLLLVQGSAPAAVDVTRAILLGTNTSGDLLPNNSNDHGWYFDSGAVIVVTSDNAGTVATTSDSNIVSYVQTKT